MDYEHMDERGSAHGLIWVGNTSRKDALKRLQSRFDRIGNIAAKFKVRGFSEFRDRCINNHGYPVDCLPIAHDWQSRKPGYHIQEGDLNDIVFDMAKLRASTPINCTCTTDLFLRYSVDEHGAKADWEQSHQFYSVMREVDLRAADMLRDGDDGRERKVVALCEQVSGLVLALPAYSVVSWLFYDNGCGLELCVYDGKALKQQMNQYPAYYDPETFVSDNAIELDIANCLDTIEKIQDRFLDPRTLKPEDLPPVPAMNNAKEGKR